jgi:hypothetical protein
MFFRSGNSASAQLRLASSPSDGAPSLTNTSHGGRGTSGCTACSLVNARTHA